MIFAVEYSQDLFFVVVVFLLRDIKIFFILCFLILLVCHVFFLTEKKESISLYM